METKVQYSGLSLGSFAQEFSLDQCDISSGLIVGGVKANENEFPHMGAIGYTNLNQELNFACGASLISERFLLTAAHCRRNGLVQERYLVNLSATMILLLASFLL